jgi:hypothetical protein
MGVWMTCAIWAHDNGTQGYVPRDIVTLLGGGSTLGEWIVKVGLWTNQGNEGIAFSSPIDVGGEKLRHSARNRQTLFRNTELRLSIRDRDGDRCRYCGKLVDWNDRRGPLGATYDHVDPDGETSYENCVVCCRSDNSRKKRRTPVQAGMTLLPPPDRSRSDLDSDLDRNAYLIKSGPEQLKQLPVSRSDLDRKNLSGPKPNQPTKVTFKGFLCPSSPVLPDTPSPKPGTETVRAKRKTRLSEDWEPSHDCLARMHERYPNLDLRAELEQFKNHHIAHGNTMSNWERAFWTWLGNAKKFGPNGNGTEPSARRRDMERLLAMKDPEPMRGITRGQK